MIKMNKKSEIITLSIILLMLVLAGYIYLQDKIESHQNVVYIGDVATNLSYNIKSQNPNCNLGQVAIERNNVRYFRNEQEVRANRFTIDNNCN